MLQGQIILGIGLIITGLVFFFLIRVILHINTQPPASAQSDPYHPTAQNSHNNEGVLVLGVGGRIFEINQRARELFNLAENDTPDIEWLSRRIRPGEGFLEICAREGQAHFSLQDSRIAVTSYRIPGKIPAMLISLRPTSPFNDQASGTEALTLPGETQQAQLEFIKAISANVDFDTAIQSILLNIERIIPADFIELNIFDPASNELSTYTLAGKPGSSRNLQLSKNSRFDAYMPTLVASSRAMLISNADTQKNHFSGSYIGIPLRAEGRLIGTLQAGRVQTAKFGPNELRLLQDASGYIAVTVSNSIKYTALSLWNEKNSALTALSQITSTANNLKTLFSGVVSGLSTLIEAEILGILLFDENQHSLQGQIPFHGLPDNIVQIYKTTAHSHPGPTHQQAMYFENASQDANWAKMGLQDVALASAMHDTTLIPLISQEQLVGYLQVSNHHSKKLHPEETHLLHIIAAQIAGAVNNIRLASRATGYERQVTAIQRISSQANKATTLDALLCASIQETAQLFRADVCAIFLMDENSGILQAHIPSAYGVPDEFVTPLSKLMVKPSAMQTTVTGSGTSFVSENLSKDRRVLPLYRAIVRKLKISSALVVPLTIEERGIGELMLGAFAEGLFSQNELQAAQTIANQLAAAIHSFTHTGETDTLLKRHSEYLLALNRITRELHSSSTIAELAKILHEESLVISAAECGAVTLCQPQQAGKTTPGEIMRVGDVQQQTISNAHSHEKAPDSPRLISECRETEAPHAGIQAVLVMPIMHQNVVYGTIELHSTVANTFDELLVETIKNTGIQAALSAGRLLRMTQQHRRIEALHQKNDIDTRLFEIARNMRISTDIFDTLKAICATILHFTAFNSASINLFDETSGLLTYSTPGNSAELAPEKFQSWEQVAQWLKPQHKHGHLYFIPASEHAAPRHASHILIPIHNENNKPVCLIHLGSRKNILPSAEALETVEMFASAGAEIIISGLQQHKNKTETDALNKQLQQLQSSQNSLPMLLHKDLEQSLALNQLWERTRHIYASLKITETISKQIDSATALRMLGEEILTGFGMAQIITAHQTQDGPQIDTIIGDIPGNLNLQTSFGLRNPLRTCLQTGETIVCGDISHDKDWQENIFLNNLRAVSFICLPIHHGNSTTAIFAADSEAMRTLGDEDRQIYHQFGRQVSIILQNISLLNETRQHLQEVNLLLDFTRQINGITAHDILATLLNIALQAVSPAHAGVAFLWDAAENLLRPALAKNYIEDSRIMGICYKPGEGLPGEVILQQAARRIDEINFVTNYNLTAENLMKYRQATGGRIPVSCLAAPIHSGGQLFGAIILDNFNTQAAFSKENEAILVSLTRQAALSVQNLRLMQAAQERNNQLNALNTAAASLSSSLNRDGLVSSLLEKLAEIIPCDTSILWMRQESRMIVADARGFEDNEERKGVTVEFAESALLNEMTRTGQAVVVNDVRKDARFASLPEHTHPSWMGVPLIIKGQVIGVLACEKKEAHYFSPELMQIAQTFASQAAAALDNATLFEEARRRASDLNERSQRLGMLNTFSAELARSLSTEEVLVLTANQLMNALHVDRAMLILLDENNKNYLLSVLPEESHHSSIYRRLPACSVLNHLRQSQTIYTVEDAPQDANLEPLTSFLKDTSSIMVIPLASSKSIYALSLHQKEKRQFTAAEIELARTISNQASVALVNSDLYQSTLETAHKLAIMNEVSYLISANLHLEDIYRATHEAAAKLMPVEAFVIALLDEQQQDIEAVYMVDLGERIKEMRLPVGKGISGRVIQKGRPILTRQAEETGKQGGITIGEKGTPHSIVAVPMISAGKVIGALIAQSYQANAYTEDDQQLLGMLANQVTVAILNARLFDEKQKFAAILEERVQERTGQLMREQKNTETLLRILSEVSANLDLDKALLRTLEFLSESINAEQGMIMLINTQDKKLGYRAGYDSLHIENTIQVPMQTIGLQLSEWVVKHHTAIQIQDLQQDSRWIIAQGPSACRSALVVPLIITDEVIGTILAMHHKSHFFEKDAFEMVKAIGSQVSIAIHNAQLFELSRSQANRLGDILRQQQIESSRQTAILEAVADGILVTDAQNAITFANASFEQILGLNKTLIMQQSLANFAGLFGKAALAWMQTVKEWSEKPAGRTGETYAGQITLENEHIALVHVAPVIWNNEFLGTVSIFRDITHEVIVDKLKSEFVATVSHELRTPMTSIRGYVDLLLMGAAGVINDQQTHFLDIVKSNTERLNILVNDLLDISKIESGRVTLSIHVIKLAEIARDVVAELKNRAQNQNKPLHISIEIDKTLPDVMGDPERIRQILGNLLDNAYNYTPALGEIKIHLHKTDDSVQVDVKDSGIGIPTEQQSRIFERFFRGENPLVLATPGTGLGLSIVKQLVEMHRGRIWMESAGIPGSGSTFSFTLPAHHTNEKE